MTTIAELVTSFEANTTGFERGLNTVSKGINGFEQMAIGAFRRVGEMTVDLMGKAFNTVGDIAKAGIDFNAMQEQAETAFTTMLGSAEKAQAFLNEMQAFAKKTPFEYPDLLIASRRLMALGFSADEVLPTLENIGNAVAAMGGNQEMIDRVTTALGQMKAKGKVQAEEMMQLTENGIAGWDMLAKKLGVDVATAMDMVTKRQVDASTGIAAIQEGIAARFGGMMDKQSRTWAGMISNLKDNFGMLSGKVMKPLFTMLEGGLSKVVEITSSPEFTAGVERFTERFANGLTMLTDAIGRFASDYWVELKILTSENTTFGEKLVAVWDMIYGVGLKIFTSLADSLGKLLPRWLEGLGEWATAIWDWIVESTPKALEKLWEWAKGLWGWLAENLPTWAANLWEWAKATWQWIVDVTPVAVAALVSLIDQLGLTIAQFLPESEGIWREIFMALDSVFWAGRNLLAGDWVGMWWFLGQAAQHGWTALSLIFTTWAPVIWEWIVNATPIALTKLGEWLIALGGWLTSNAPAWGQKLATWGKAAWQWIVDATSVAVTKLGEWGAALWQWLVTNGPSWVGALDAWGRAAWQWIADAIGPVATQLGALAEEFISWKDVVVGSAIALGILFAPAIGTALGAAATAIGAFVAAWAPVLVVFAAAIAGVALVRNAWERDWGGIQTKTIAALNFLTTAFAPLMDAIKQFGGDSLKEIIAWATGNKTNFEATTKIWEAAKTSFTTVFDAIGAKLAEWGAIAWEWFKTNFPEAAAALMLAVSNIKRNFAELWTAAEPLIQKLKDAWAAFTTGASEEGGFFGIAMQRLKNLLDGIWAIMVTAAGLAINNIINSFTLIIQLINGDWWGAWQTMKQMATGTWDALVSMARIGVNALLGLFGMNIDDVTHWFQEVRGTLRAMLEQFRQWGRDIIDGLWGGLKENWYHLSTWFTGVWGELTNRFKAFFGIHSPSKLFAGYGANMMQGLTNGIDATRSKVFDAIDAVSTGLTSNISVGASDYAYAGGYASSNASTTTDDTVLMRENNMLLRQLIAALQAKNMTANVTVAGGGSITDSNMFALGLRGV